MANKQLFSSAQVAMQANHAGAKAYALSPREALAQLAVTGCLGDAFYADAQAQLAEVLALCPNVEPAFVAKAAVYGRRHGRMKDLPVLLLAWLTVHAPTFAEAIFDEVVDTVAQLAQLRADPALRCRGQAQPCQPSEAAGAGVA